MEICYNVAPHSSFHSTPPQTSKRHSPPSNDCSGGACRHISCNLCNSCNSCTQTYAIDKSRTRRPQPVTFAPIQYIKNDSHKKPEIYLFPFFTFFYPSPDDIRLRQPTPYQPCPLPRCCPTQTCVQLHEMHSVEDRGILLFSEACFSLAVGARSAFAKEGKEVRLHWDWSSWGVVR
jgi:hypothetical protein